MRAHITKGSAGKMNQDPTRRAAKEKGDKLREWGGSGSALSQFPFWNLVVILHTKNIYKVKEKKFPKLTAKLK